ncbi:MAG: glycoside hydrolase family 172 protein [Candidatus Sumerlaeaceae bacterium]
MLTNEQKDNLIQRIVQAVDPMKIILFGSSSGMRTSALLVGLVVLLYPVNFHAETLDALPHAIRDYTAARVSSTDKTGANVDHLHSIEPGETRVLADIKGAGMITHIWCTIAAERWYGRKLVLRMYWDGEKNPSVLAPLGDFFCQGHGLEANVWSQPITCTSNGRAKNCFFKMPFNKNARIEITNEGLEPVGAIYYYVDYRKYKRPHEDLLYFHAHYRQEYPAVSGTDYLVCSARGHGHFAGAVLSYEQRSDGWYGEGDDRFYVDGETSASLVGTGTEDYLCDAWGVWKGSSPYYGTTIHEGEQYATGSRYTSYRFHIADPIPFRKSLRFDIEHYGAGVLDGKPDGFVERADNLSSMAYWYQSQRRDPLEPLPPVGDRLPEEALYQKHLLNFLGKARTPGADGLDEIRQEFSKLYLAPAYASHRTLLRMAMAHAELKTGGGDRITALLQDSLRPFVNRSLLEDDQLKSYAADRITSLTPILCTSGDGSGTVTTVAETIGAMTDTRAGKGYLYFAVPETSPIRDTSQTIHLRVRYYSAGETSDTLTIHYNSKTAEGKVDAYRNSETLQKPLEAGWHTAEFRLPDAYFAGKQNAAADFRISANNDGDEAIAELTILPQ